MIQLHEPPPRVSPGPRPRADLPASPTRRGTARQEARLDADLVRRFLAGESSAFEEIVERHRARLVAAACSILRNPADAEEIAQDAFVCAHRALPNFRGDCSLSTWLHYITRNLARNRYWYFHRRRRHVTCSLDHAVNDDSDTTLVNLLACGGADPVRETTTREFRRLIAECMERLDPRHRVILALSHQLGYEEIARRLDIKCGTVKSRIARARENLRALLCAACPDFGSRASPAAWLEPRRETEALAAAPGSH